MAKHGKAYREARERYDREHEYAPAEAVALVKAAASSASSTSRSRCTSAPGLNVRHADQQVRGTIALPHGLGQDVKVAVFAQGDKAREAEDAGADVVGARGPRETRSRRASTDFDVAIATPDMMPVVGRLGRILGPQGKMPNPKVGTVTMDVGRAVEQAKAGQVEYRTDRTGDRPPRDRQVELRRAAAARELRGADRGDRARQAGRGEGQLHPLDHAHHDDGPGRPGRPDAHARHRGGGAARGVASFQERPARDPRQP